MRPLLSASVLLSSLVLSACSPLGPLADATAVYSLQASGNMIFECAYDEKGPYWAFRHPEGRLITDEGMPFARLRPDFGLTHKDGSELSARITKTGDADGPGDLRDAVFEATDSSTFGALRGIRFVERRHAKGGIPLAACSPSQRGMRLAVPFEARYILYR